MGAQKSCLIETFLLSTHKISFVREIRKKNCKTLNKKPEVLYFAFKPFAKELQSITAKVYTVKKKQKCTPPILNRASVQLVIVISLHDFIPSLEGRKNKLMSK